MFLMMFLAQLPTDPPTSFAALQWIVLGALTTALVYVFRLWQRERKNSVDRDRATIDRLMSALHDQLDNPGDVDITDVN